MYKAAAAKAKRRVLEMRLLIEEKEPHKPHKLPPGAAVIVHCKGVAKRYPLMISPMSEQTIQMAADRLEDSDFQELARLVDAQLLPLVLKSLS